MPRGVPRIWEKLHAAIHIRMQEPGGLRQRLFEALVASCARFAEKSPGQRSLGERLRFALGWLLMFRALQNFIGLRRTRIALTGAASIPPPIIAFFRTIGVPLVEVYGRSEEHTPELQ